ncbi:endonuclease VII domain-containing protein [Streptomyces liangshanensis]|uniref:endonuclease VII domain-containing protein n=1 Tax=Streptomyces liangshanensis TaxID=2717324 RepID=UPI0036DC3BEB
MLPRDAFNKHRRAWDGLQAYCRGCSAEYSRRYHASQDAEPPLPAKAKAPPGHKRCPRCHEVKPHADWERNRTSSDGYASYCKICRAQRNRASYFTRKYGITEAQRDEMISSQMGICTICLAAPAVHVDHCHETGRVRGVLCFNCNSAIGKLGDDPDTLRRAIAYLEGNAWKPTLVAPGVYQLPS